VEHVSNRKIEACEVETYNEAEFFSLPRLAKRWDTSYRTLHRKVQEGKLRAIRLGALVRVPRTEVERVERHGL
jgi:excisionase family DNA binding protein